MFDNEKIISYTEYSNFEDCLVCAFSLWLIMEYFEEIQVQSILYSKIKKGY
jgi:hypothetical protein